MALTTGQIIALSLAFIMIIAIMVAVIFSSEPTPVVATAPPSMVATAPTAESLPVTEAPTVVITPSGPQYVGCYGDRSDRAVAGERGYISFQACVDHAKSIGSPFFSVQDGNETTGIGQCFAAPPGASLDDAKKYGVATNCVPIVNADLVTKYPGSYMGKPWSNAIYTL